MIEEKTMGITTTLKKTYPRKLPNAPGSPRVRWRRGRTGSSSASALATSRPVSAGRSRPCRRLPEPVFLRDWPARALP